MCSMLARVNKDRTSKFGHCKIQIRPLGGQNRPVPTVRRRACSGRPGISLLDPRPASTPMSVFAAIVLMDQCRERPRVASQAHSLQSSTCWTTPRRRAQRLRFTARHRLDSIVAGQLLADFNSIGQSEKTGHRDGTAGPIFNIGNVWSRPVNADRDAVRGALSQRILVRSLCHFQVRILSPQPSSPVSALFDPCCR
jgi:hypothetical protein